MTNEQLQQMGDFFVKKLFGGIPSIPCIFTEITDFWTGEMILGQSGRFSLTKNEKYNLQDEDPEMAKMIVDAPEYRVVNKRDASGFGYDIYSDLPWMDPLNKPNLQIEIDESIQHNKYRAVGVLLHELTHYYCWYCGFDYLDGEVQFEQELKKRHLVSNLDDDFNYFSMQYYIDLFEVFTDMVEL